MQSGHPIRRCVPEEKEVAVGEKIEEAYIRLRVEAEHHTKLAQARDDAFENGFAQGFSEATRIVTSPPEGDPVEDAE
jgi:flagellar biosynthesis/type III secretory pathway protein FliH